MTPKPTPSAKNLVWIDLEMTGLDSTTDVILQAALVVTTADLEPLDAFSADVRQPEEALAHMTPFVRDMHIRTGLLERVRESTNELRQVERLLIERVTAWCIPPATLCGNSVWIDRRFIERHMPNLERLLHYRLVDVSSVKVLAQCWYGSTAVFDKPSAGEHDAAVDIDNSIAELRHYRRLLFRDPSNVAH